MKKTITLLGFAGILFCWLPQLAFGQVSATDTVYKFVPKMPEYPGGNKGILSYFVTNMRYPLEAYMNGVNGTAYVSFIVEKDGSVSDVHVLKPVGSGCDKEAVRLVKSMTGWLPGELNGQKVRVRENVPVYFKEKFYPGSRIYTNPDTLPYFPGGEEALASYLDEETKIPPEAEENNIRGQVTVNFVVEKDGTVSNIVIQDSLGYGCDEEAVRVISNLPRIEPGYLNGMPVRTLISLNVNFNDNIYVVVEEMPQFPGGKGAFMQYLASNIKYPTEAENNGIQGTVYVNFVIEPDGSVSNIKVLKGIGGGCDQEAVRIIKNMPKWEPGKQKGKPVRVVFNLPINFSLTKKN